jgi:snoRNA binding domain, fibrillarin
VANSVVVVRQSTVYLVAPPPALPRAFPAALGRARASVSWPREFLNAVRSLPPGSTLEVDSVATAKELGGALTTATVLASIPALRRARAAVPPLALEVDRSWILAVAHDALERALTTPEEVLISFAREEERLERTLGREARASESFLTTPGSPLAQYADAWAAVRKSLSAHHTQLLALLGTHARTVVPNLASVVGARTAARLVSAAGSVDALSRMRAGRIQLLGTRRRPSPERGPRYGLLYRADGMDSVPPDRRGAYARSLGALAAIAARADATTHASIAKGLVARRDRRIAQLQRRAR